MAHSRYRWLFGAFAVAAMMVGAACEDDSPGQPDGAPGTVGEFFEALDFGLSGDGRPYHFNATYTQVEGGNEKLWGRVEAWVALREDRARWEFTKGPDNGLDIAGHWVSVYEDGANYFLNLEADDPVQKRGGSDLKACLPEAPTYLLGLVACGTVFEELEGWTPSVEPSTFEGSATISLVLRKPVDQQPAYPRDVPPPPGGWPTPEPAVAAAKSVEMRIHLDAVSFLPLAITQSLDSDPRRTRIGGLIRFTGGFVSATGLSSNAFSAAALGWVEPQEEERRILEDPKLEARVYWLGRSFAPGGGLPPLGNLHVNGYHLGRIRGSDEPNIQVGLAYSGQGGMVRLDHYPPGDWEKFKASLGGNFPWTWCGGVREFAAGAAKVTVLSGYESFPYRMDGVVTVVPVTPGQLSPTRVPGAPTIPPLKTEPCPGTRHDRFMAEVRFPDATVVINGTLGYGGQEGQPWGVYDTGEALEIIARALRPRQPGE